MILLKARKKERSYKVKKDLLAYCEKFKTIADFKKFIKEKGKTPDYIAIADVPFTMEEYDSQGKFINYLNKKLMLSIVVCHEDRYRNFKDVLSVEIDDAGCYRNDISFLE